MTTNAHQHPLERFRDRWFPSHEDETWKSWVDMQKRNFSSLTDLVHDPKVRETFKARALIVLMAPVEKESILYWKPDLRGGNSFSSYLEIGSVELQSLSQDLIRFTAQLLQYTYQYVGAAKSRQTTGILSACSQYLLRLLSLLPVEEVEMLWPYFQINDVEAYEGWIDGSSGYRPWTGLMCEPSIPMYWKRIADEQLRLVVDEELAGKRFPRAEWEAALPCYVQGVNYIMGRICRGSFQYDQELLASQLAYLDAKSELAATAFIKSYYIAAAFRVLLDSRYESLLQALGRRALNYGDSSDLPFHAYDENTLEAAQGMRRVFTGDHELQKKLAGIIEAGASKVEHERRHRRYEQEVLAKMRA